MSPVDRAILALAPRWGLSRLRARMSAEIMQRHYEAAQGGRRTENWRRVSRDANAATGPALTILRNHARDLVRNNPYARRGKLVVGNHGVGWGIHGKAVNAGSRNLKRANQRYQDWSESTACDFDGLNTMPGIQRLALETVAEAGEVLIRRRRRPLSEGLSIPMQVQVLEPDYIDTNKDGLQGPSGGPIILGVEFDTLGRRVAYWLYPEHPGATGLRSARSTGFSQRVPVEDLIHLYRVDRPGQVRGITWYAPVIVRLKNHDEYEDATLMRQKIAACFAAAITDVNGAPDSLVGRSKSDESLIETIEPGMLLRLGPGKDLKFIQPPPLTDHASLNVEQLRGIAMGLGVAVEDLTGNYQNMPFSAAKMSRISHWAGVFDWQYNILIPRGCKRIHRWAMESLELAGELTEVPGSEWTPQPMPMIEPDKEALAYLRAVRAGYMTPDEMIRERGFDPDTHWEAYAEQLRRLDKLGIVLDIDARTRTQAGNAIGAPSDAAMPPAPPDDSGQGSEQ